MDNTPISVFWFRRDLRLDDNAGLYHALKQELPVLCLFIFDTEILDKLDDKGDKRVLFIHNEIRRLNDELKALGSAILVKVGKSEQVWAELLKEYSIKAVYANHDYETYGQQRDKKIGELLKKNGTRFKTFKDIVVFEKEEVVKDDGLPYTVFTPYSKKWRAKLDAFQFRSYPALKYTDNFFKTEQFEIPSLESLGFSSSTFVFPPRVIKASIITAYSEKRDFPSVSGTSRLGIHLRFGTLSVRKLLAYALQRNETYVNELIWRDFYQQILWHFPNVEKGAFRKEYDKIEWRNNEDEFELWCKGKTGIPLVDAGMRELNATGYMHNRVRMVVASFLTKHLLIDWRWGEAYFAEKLLDFDLAANNGGWQWAAGCGTDAAPYFRVFNPITQAGKFDPDGLYIKQWVPEFDTPAYPKPIVGLAIARDRCLAVYRKALKA